MLRESLILAERDLSRIDKIKRLTKNILQLCDDKKDAELEINELKELTSLECLDKGYFESLHCHSSVEEFANMAALPRPKKVPDISRRELIDIARRAKDVTSWDAEYYMHLLDANVILPSASNLIFYPPESYIGKINDYDPTPDQIVDWAMETKNIICL